MGAAIKSGSKEVVITLSTKDSAVYFEMCEKQRESHEINQALLALLPKGARYHHTSIETKKHDDYWLIRLYPVERSILLRSF